MESVPVDGFWKPPNQRRLVVYHVIYRVLYIPGGAGLIPSRVWILHQYFFWHLATTLPKTSCSNMNSEKPWRFKDANWPQHLRSYKFIAFFLAIRLGKMRYVFGSSIHFKLKCVGSAVSQTLKISRPCVSLVTRNPIEIYRNPYG